MKTALQRSPRPTLPRLLPPLLMALVCTSPSLSAAQEEPPSYPQPTPGYPQPAPAYPQGAPVYPQEPPQQPMRLTLTGGDEEAKSLTWACADALDNFHPQEARSRCKEALTRDPLLAVAHALAAEAAPGAAAAQQSLNQAQEAQLQRPVSAGERLLVEALRLSRQGRLPEARQALDALCTIAAAERRAFALRGRVRQRMGDLDGAITDYKKAAELDDKYGATHNALGFLYLAQGKLAEATAAFQRYTQLSPKEANAQDSLAYLHLRKGELPQAEAAARRALELDAKFSPAQAKLGDALLFQGKAAAARKAYAAMEASEDAATHHEGAMRIARSFLLDGIGLSSNRAFADAERVLLAEIEIARKARRGADQAHALTELARLQIERNSLFEAGQTLRLLKDLLSPKGKGEGQDGKPPEATLTPEEQQRAEGERALLRALLLIGVGEQELADARLSELGDQPLGRTPQMRARAQELRGDLAARAGDGKRAAQLLDKASRPTMRLALALALTAGKEPPAESLERARSIMEELSKRNHNDLETVLTRARARAWLKTAPQKAPEAKAPEAKTRE